MRITVLLTATILLLGGCSTTHALPSPELKAAVERANQAFVRATRSADPSQLVCCFTGESLRNLTASVQAARDRGHYAVSTLESMTWGPATQAGDTATVVTTERWEHIHRRRSDDGCVVRVPARDVKQTYHLTRREGSWVVERIMDDPGNPPSRPAECTEVGNRAVDGRGRESFHAGGHPDDPPATVEPQGSSASRPNGGGREMRRRGRASGVVRS